MNKIILRHDGTIIRQVYANFKVKYKSMDVDGLQCYFNAKYRNSLALIDDKNRLRKSCLDAIKAEY